MGHSHPRVVAYLLVGALAVSASVVTNLTHALAAGQFTTFATGFTQELYGLEPGFLGGVAFAPNGDPVADNCVGGGGSLHRWDHATTLPTVNGTSTLHPESTMPSSAGCGLT